MSEEKKSIAKLRAIQLKRVLLALVICLLALGTLYINIAVGLAYHPGDYDSPGLWLFCAVVIAVTIVIGWLVAFWRFQSEQRGEESLQGGILLIIFVFAVLFGIT